MGFTLPVGLIQTGVGGGSPPAFIASAFSLVGSMNNSVTVNKPTGTTLNDTMVFFYWGRSNATQISGSPGGWTTDVSVTTVFDAIDHWAYLYHKVAGGSEPANYTWNLNGGAGEKAGVILTYRPAHGTQLEVTGNEVITTSSASHPQSTMSTTFANARLVYAWMLNRVGAATLNLGGWTNPAGMTERYKDNYTTLARPDVGLAIYDEARPTAGSVGTRTLTTADSDVASLGIRCAIRAA